MKKAARILFSFTVLLLLNSYQLVAQCAMCRAAVENNVNNDGDKGMAAALNSGILYLFVMPYLAIMVVGYLWYRNSKKNAKSTKISFRRPGTR